MSIRLPHLIVSLAILTVMANMAYARSKLTAEQAKTCKTAQKEYNSLNTPKLRSLLSSKPPTEQVKTLSTEQLQNLRRLIKLDQKLIFECRLIAYTDLNRRKPSALSLAKDRILSVPDVPIRNPKLALAKPRQAVQQDVTRQRETDKQKVIKLPLPLRKPKYWSTESVFNKNR